MVFFVHKLGCPKNDVDADYIAGHLVRAGHIPAVSVDSADVIVVNTCGFIEAAKQESVDSILNLAAMKKDRPQLKLLVAGCLAQRYSDQLATEIPEIDGIFGLGELDALAVAVGEADGGQKRSITDPRHMTYLAGGYRHIDDDLPYAYLKISDGCNRGCSYCAIPAIRGSFRSRPTDSVVREAEYLAQNGKRELILVSQDATLYGHDLAQSGDIVSLLEGLELVPGVDWVRLLYLHPANTTAELIGHLADPANKSLPYFDLPLQHINDRMLKQMNRRCTRSQIEALLKTVRARSAGAVLRTTFIVGFPGETEAMFEELLGFVAEQEFDRAAAFVYSQEEGTAAADLPDQVDEETKSRRLDLLMTLQQGIAFEKNRTLIGSTRQVMLDRLESHGAVGRTVGDCPDIDQEVIVSGSGLAVGKLVSVRIEETDGYDLVGTVVAE